MTDFTQKWAIISLLEDADEGYEFDVSDTPLHITLAGVFAIEKNGRQITQDLEKLLKSENPIEVKAEKKALFGPDKDVAVMTVKKEADLMKLYSKIHNWLLDSGAKYNSPEYQGEGYLPHSTFQKSGALKEGEMRTLDSVSLIDLFPNGDGHRRRITKTLKL